MKFRKMKISDVFRILGGNPAPKDKDAFGEKGIPFLKMKDLGKYHLTNNLIDIENRVSDIIALKNKLKLIRKGAILLPRSGSVALNHRAILGVDTYMVSHICALEVKEPKKFYNQYLYYYLCTINMQKITKKTTGLDAITFEDLNKLKIPIPEKYEDQIRIATILSRVDNLITKRKESIQFLDDLLKSTFLEMFGDSTKFKLNPIKQIASKGQYSLSSGPFGSNLTSKHYVNDGIAILRGKNISSGHLDLSDLKYVSEEKAIELKRSELKPDDIVIVAVGSSGTALKIPQTLPHAIMSQNFNKITPNKDIVLPIYLEYSINSEIVQRQFKRVMTDGGRTFLALSKIKEIEIPLPTIEAQYRFESVVEKVELIKSHYQKSLIELESLYGSLSQRAFKGELNLSKVRADVVLTQETAALKMEIHQPTVTVKNGYTENDLMNVLKKFSRKTFSFDELWVALTSLNLSGLPEKSVIQDKIVNLLESEESDLTQVFDFLFSEDSEDNKKKKIALRVANAN